MTPRRRMTLADLLWNQQPVISRLVDITRGIVGGDMFDPTTEHSRFRNDDGSETAATWSDVEDTDPVTIDVADIFRLRLVVEQPNTATGSDVFRLQYENTTQVTGWNDVTTTSSHVRAVPSADTSWTINDGDATTDQIGGAGTFVAGEMDEDGITNSATSFSANSHTEIEYVLQLQSGDVANSDNIDFRLVNGMGQVISANVTPSVTVTGAVSFVVEQVGWRWFEDGTGPLTALAAENVKPTLPGDQNYKIVRGRVELEETGGGADANKVVLMQMSGDDGVTWETMLLDDGADDDKHVVVGNGADVAGNTLTSRLLANTDTSGKYHETQVLVETLNANEKLEVDFALFTRVVLPDRDYRFRLFWDGVAVPIKSAAVKIELRGSTAATREESGTKNSIAPLLEPSSGDPDTMSWGHGQRGFYDGARWWVFWTDEIDLGILNYHSTADLAAGWSVKSTRTFATDIGASEDWNIAFKEIGGTKYVIAVFQTSATNRIFRRGTISGSTITWDTTERSFTNPHLDARDGSPGLAIDDGNFLWFGGKGTTASNEIWAQRSTNTFDNATYHTFNTAKSASESGIDAVGTPFGGPEMIGMASGEVLLVYYDMGNTNLRARRCTESGGMGSPVTINTSVNAHDVDWGIARGNDGNIYCVYLDGTAAASNWLLRVYSESGNSWAAGTNPSVLATATANDGLLVHWGDDGKLYASDTEGDTSSRDTRSRYKSYTGGTAGTWDVSLTFLTPSKVGNADNRGKFMDGANWIVLIERGDDGLIGTDYVLEYYVLDTAGAAGAQTLTGTLFSKAPSFIAGILTAEYVLDGALFSAVPTFIVGIVTPSYVLDGSLFVKPPGFITGAVTADYALSGSVFSKPPTFITGALVPDQTLTGSLFSVPPAFIQGSIASIYVIVGNLFARPPTFIQGVLTAVYTINGVLFSNPPTFIQGVVTPGGVTLAGVLFSKAPTFIQGIVSTDYALTGILFTNVGTFTSGAITADYALTGSLFSVPPSFFAGTMTTAYTINGILFSNPSTFIQGTVTQGKTLQGVLFSKPPTFIQGTIIPGGVTLDGVLFLKSPVFIVGLIASSYVIVGNLFARPPTFITGSLTSDYSITGVVFSAAPVFVTGVITPGGVTLSGSLFSAPPSFIQGIVTQGITLQGSLFSKPPTFIQGVVTPGGVTIDGSLFSASPTFIVGVLGADYALSGLLYSNPPIFIAGTLTTAYTFSGILYSNPPSFPVGVVSLSGGPQTITGSLFSKSPSFIPGVIEDPYVIDGVLFSNSPVFPTGTLTTAYDLQGVLFSKPSSFVVGTFTPTNVLDGVLFSRGPSFIQGVIILGGVTLSGSLFSNPPSFITGVLTEGKVLHGVLFSASPTFFVGVITIDQFLVGSLFSKPPTFIVGYLGAEYTLDGSLFSVPPVFIQGTITPGGVTIAGVLFSNPPVFPIGIVNLNLLVGILFSAPPTFFPGSVKISFKHLKSDLRLKRAFSHTFLIERTFKVALKFSSTKREFLIGESIELEVMVSTTGTKSPVDPADGVTLQDFVDSEDVTVSGFTPLGFAKVEVGQYELTVPTTGIAAGVYRFIVHIKDGTNLTIARDRFVLSEVL